MSFSNTQLTKNMSSRLFHDIINPQNNKKYVIFKYAISKKTCHHVLYSLLIYITSFATITPKEYKKLVDNERKLFDLTKNFTSPEILNKYRYTDKNIDDKIKKDEKIKEKYENLDKIINKSIDRLKIKPENDLIDNYTYISDDKNDHTLDYDIDMSDLYKREYKFDNDDSILDSFSKIYEEHDMEYQPREKTQFIRVRYLLQKIKESKNVPTNLYNHFHTSLSENNKLYHKIPTYQEEEQIGSSVNNIIINDKDLNNGILRIRYLNNRKLTNNLLKHDYKISKNMVNAIEFNKDIHKLSKNEMKMYHELQKFLNKEQDTNVLIGSYLSGNNSKKLYNKISSVLYNKLKNNIISKKEYTKLINKINKILYYMEYILTSNQHKIKNNCLRYAFQKPIRFQNQYISLTSMIFYNYFENISDKFKLIVKNKTQSYTINFTNGSYYTSDISKIIDDEIKNNFKNISEKEKYVQIVVNINRYAILIVIKKDWILELDNNFVELFGFEKIYGKKDIIDQH